MQGRTKVGAFLIYHIFQIMKNKILAKTSQVLIYPKWLMPICNSVTACILLQQLDYWIDHAGQGFYKFLKPTPNNKLYKPGDSWTEELAFGVDEFRSAFDKIGIRYKSKADFENAPDKFQNKFYASYVDRIKRTTHYFRNDKLLDRKLNELIELETNSPEMENPISRNGQNRFPEVGITDFQYLKESEITTEITSVSSAGKKSGKNDAGKKYDKRTKDERSGHAAIQFIRELLNRYPDKILWDDIIKWFGEDFDRAKLTLCRKTWISRGYNPNATTWMRWYFEGIPEQVSAAQIEAAKDKKAWQSVGKSPETMNSEKPEDSDEEKMNNENIEYEEFCFNEAVKMFRPDFVLWTQDFKNYIPVWQNILDEIKSKLNAQVFSSWFGTLEYAGAEENSIYIFASETAKDWIESYYANHFTDAFEKIGKPEMRVVWVVEQYYSADAERNTKFYFRKVLADKFRRHQDQ